MSQLPGSCEQIGIDGAAVDVLQGDPPSRQEPVQLDDPAHQIGVGLLPERFPALAEGHCHVK